MRIVFYLHLHQPWRLARFRYLDLGSGRSYFDEPRNLAIFRRITDQCYVPALGRLEQALTEHPEFRFSLSITGTWIEQARLAAPELLPQIKRILGTGRVKVAGETYYHSLAFLLPPPELTEEVTQHEALLDSEFQVRATVLRMTELAFSDDLARFAAARGYRAMLGEGWEGVLGDRPPTRRYAAQAAPDLSVLLRHYRLSDDVGYRFSSQAWNEYPLTAEKYVRWIAQTPGEFVGVFLDFETFGEHHAASTGILEFLSALPGAAAREPGLSWATVEDLFDLPVAGTISSPTTLTWADAHRDLGAWLGNDLQRSAFEAAKKAGTLVSRAGDPELWTDWRKLLTSDHFYYMYLGGHGADMGVHQYFSSYGSPYDAYANYMNALTDLRERALARIRR